MRVYSRPVPSAIREIVYSEKTASAGFRNSELRRVKCDHSVLQ